ncbi:hypothetical protein BDZ94DRAFT_915958 [Collybia nuda]|uniref:Uncharacterized protein n=1 Tax=Collybia nuda TaxID=64659 RepID=A0A9P5YD95_9AGAR|nr:hypothetical protein BDZ94DRAFT_915958 [Collybia nuda]
MFSKAFAAAILALTFTVQVHAHAAVSPVLGVAGAPKRSDVQRPRAATPCGKTNIAANLDTSTPVAAAADGSFTMTITNFNLLRDGSRQVDMTVDATATGQNFVAGTVTKNGEARPLSLSSEQITASLPAGTKCTGGAAGNLCLASFKSLGGFGNCVVVQQGAAAAAAGNATAGAGTAAAGTAGNTGAGGAAAGAGTAAAGTSGATAGTAGAAGAAAGTAGTTTGAAGTGGAAGGAAGGATTGTGATGNGATRKEKIAQAAKDLLGKNAGTRAPRALRAEMEVRGEDAVRMFKRGVLNWMWV